MSCEFQQEQASRFTDGELPEQEQIPLFRHLEDCSECRSFLDAILRFRQGARRDREEILAEADGLAIPAVGHVASGRGARMNSGGADSGRRKRFLGRGWMLPIPAGVAIALVLLATGFLLGARLGAAPGDPGRPGLAERIVEPDVVVVCSLPVVEVLGDESFRSRPAAKKGQIR